MDALEAYRSYLAIKNHFTKPSYDYFKYNGKTNVSSSSFEKRKDKLFFQKIAKHSDLVNYLVANISENPKIWSKDLAYSEAAEKAYTAWKKKQESLTYLIKDELSKLDEDFKDNFIIKNGNHPKLLKLYLGGELSLETLCILLNITGAKAYWDKQLEYDIIWIDLSFKVDRYLPFLIFDKAKIKSHITENFDL